MPKGLSLIGTGAALGAVHVLTGPDHVSALATLSANIGSASAAFCLGVRWGLGHSTGLLLVGIVFILLSRRHREEENVEIPDGMTHAFEAIIGVYMLLLGMYGIHRACDKRAKEVARSNLPTESQQSELAQQHHHSHRDTTGASESNISDRGWQESTPNADELSYQNHVAGSLQLGKDHDGKLDGDDDDSSSKPLGCLRRCVNKVSTQTLALLTGILHGLAGPGGVLAIIPAVQLRDARLATIYLGSFCISSTLTMGLFATVYGTCSTRLAEGNASSQRVFRIECGSACLSLIVGILWLTLLAIGKLDEVFP